MKVERNEYLVVYAGQNMGVYLYQKLLKKPCNVELVSTPSKIYRGCSHSVKFYEDDMDDVIDETKKLSSQPKGIYRIVKDGKYETYQKIS